MTHSMGWVLYALLQLQFSRPVPWYGAGRGNCLEDVSTEDLIRLTEIEQKILPSSRKLLKLKFIELNQPVNAFDTLTSDWATTWLLNPLATFLEWLHAKS